jgi:hypothetical protein
MVNSQSSIVCCVLTFVMHVLKNAKDMMLTIAKSAHRHAATAPKNAEEWLVSKRASFFLFDHSDPDAVILTLDLTSVKMSKDYRCAGLIPIHLS